MVEVKLKRMKRKRGFDLAWQVTGVCLELVAAGMWLFAVFSGASLLVRTYCLMFFALVHISGRLERLVIKLDASRRRGVTIERSRVYMQNDKEPGDDNSRF